MECSVGPFRLNFFFQAEDGIRDLYVTGVQTCALPICAGLRAVVGDGEDVPGRPARGLPHAHLDRSEEHTSELQSRRDLVCRLLLEKKNAMALQTRRPTNPARRPPRRRRCLMPLIGALR